MQFTYMQHMHNNNLEISPAASSVVPANGLYLIKKISKVRATGSSMFYNKVLTLQNKELLLLLLLLLSLSLS